MDFAVPADHRIKLKESEKKVKHLDLAGVSKKTMEHESDGDTKLVLLLQSVKYCYKEWRTCK